MLAQATFVFEQELKKIGSYSIHDPDLFFPLLLPS
jgi:hypothetical protein